jgi:RNA polymerase sigma-70 factor (ECF subfamily)
VNEGEKEATLEGDGSALMERVRAGDREGFRALFRAFQAPARRYFHRTHGDGARAEDCVQELFLRLWTKRGLYRGDGTFLGWFYRIASSVAADAGRRERRWRAQAEARRDEARGEAEGTAVEASAADRVAREEEAARVRRAIDALPPDLRETFLLSRVRGLAYPRIAEALGITVKGVEKRMTRCFEKLREALAGPEGGGR